MDGLQVELRRLTGKDATPGNAARYLELMRELTTMPDDMTSDEAIRFIAGSVTKGFYIFGAFAGGELISVVNIHLTPHLKGLEARVEDVVTRKPFRRQTAFRQLHKMGLKYVTDLYPKKWGKNRGIYKVTLASKPEAEEVYLHLGYKRHENEYAIYF